MFITEVIFAAISELHTALHFYVLFLFSESNTLFAEKKCIAFIKQQC